MLYGPAILLEYGGLEFSRISLDKALDLTGSDRQTLIAIECPQSGHHDKMLSNQGMHSKMIMKASREGVRDAYSCARAYWLPSQGKLILYQMETPSGHMIDPPEDIIERLAHYLNIRNKIMSIDIIE